MSNFDDLLAKLASSGASVTVVHNVVQAGATLTINFGCHFGGSHTPKAAKGRPVKETEDTEENDQDAEVEQAANRENRGAPAAAPAAQAPAASAAAPTPALTPAPAAASTPAAAPAPASPLLAEIKPKVSLLQNNLINKIASHLERLDTLSEEQLGEIKTIFDKALLRDDELDELDALFDIFFPDLKD